jgi:SAM-dependent methyltransferase
VLGIARAFMESRVLLSAVELDLFSLLAEASLSADEVAARLKSDPRATTVLLDALAAMGLLEKAGDRYRATAEAGALLSADAPGSVLPMARHAAHLWTRWSRLTEIVRHGLTPESAPGPRGDDALRAFIGAMHVVGAPQADAVVAAVDLAGVTRILDVGGASGTYAMAFLRRAPRLRATVFDLPPVIELARERLGREGFLDRVELAAGDFYGDELPGGHDLAWLSAIIHQNSPEENRQLYARIHRALVPGGRVVIRDHVMAPSRIAPRAGALFAVNMLVGTPGGGTYTFDEIRGDLEGAGFTRVELLRPDERMNGLVTAVRPANGGSAVAKHETAGTDHPVTQAVKVTG